MASAPSKRRDPLSQLHPAVRGWFEAAFTEPTLAQRKGWAPIFAGESTLLLAPTGSGKTLAAFLLAIDRLMFAAPSEAGPAPEPEGVKVLYISPLKALGVDVERNLRAPLSGIRAIAERDGYAHRVPSVGVRSGDTPPQERARMVRRPPDILITTPESLFLLLTSQARETLRGVSTVIVDEIHSLVAGKRGAHLFVSLERLEHERGEDAAPLQRIGLSATQRPLDEVARLLGGYAMRADGSFAPRPVTIVDAGRKRALDLHVEVPVEDMARVGELDVPAVEAMVAAGPKQTVERSTFVGETQPGVGQGGRGSPGVNRSIWPSIHPRLVELIEAHRSTMLFVNNRSLAERLSQA
ncbi:MAG: DEAD/DEAH box helicase, partial [Enhygromyxa sp.]